jgi:hypothetical protein
MIIIGYQGIGKSTAAKDDLRYIDLESTNFRVGPKGEKDEHWHAAYANIALDLSRQGYRVFVSSHAPVRQWLGEHQRVDDFIFICYPSISIKEGWIERLQRRFDQTKLRKDELALLNAKDRYVDNIREMILDAEKYHFIQLEIKGMTYDLKSFIEASFDQMADKLKDTTIPVSGPSPSGE